MATAQIEKSVDNGVNVEALFGAQAALKDAPEAAKFKWRSTVEWINGTHSRSTIESFYGLGAEQKHKKKFTFDADHPEVFAAADHSATPVEIVLAIMPSKSADEHAALSGSERTVTLRARAPLKQCGATRRANWPNQRSGRRE
jgi:hypothetical protein